MAKRRVDEPVIVQDIAAQAGYAHRRGEIKDRKSVV